LAEGLARAEDTVTVYLTAGAVTTSHGRLAQLLEARVKVFADPDALEARGMKERALARGVVSVPFEALVAKWAA
ncbi:MAG TPA: hypothetical protein VHM19_03935, partial [Polyangiales bacterium]|nr:hypothetical protein [Polyangiales bacterium]